MSDLDVLRENIIQAALAYREADGSVHADGKCAELFMALDAYDAALKPDVWELLEETLDRDSNDLSVSLEERIEAALLWRKENPDA